MPSLPWSSQSRSSSNRSRRASYRDATQQTSYRDAAQQTSESRSSSRRRRRPASPNNRCPHRPPSPSPARPSARDPSRKRFGLNVPTNQARIGKFDFEDIYPEDPIYEELGPNARAWRVNLDECEVYDNDMVTEARDGLDLLLVFAGLFSAVLTTFVAQTSQALSNNFPAVSTSLLLEIVTLQRAFINGTPINEISSSEMTSGPSGFDVWVNALWFTSLALSLGTALIAVLVKQWLYQYMSIVSGTARDRSLIRIYRFDGLRKWHVLTIIGTLPIVLHVALGLFLAGLVVFLVPLNVPLATVVGFITVVIYTMYTVSNILPIIYTQCPYRTPFSDILNVLMRPIFTLISSAWASASARALHTHTSPSDPSTSQKVVYSTLKDAERIAATGDEAAESIACDVLIWLYQMTSNPPTKSIVLQSLGCLSDTVSDRLCVVRNDLENAFEEVIYEPGRWSIHPGLESRAERLLRAQRHITVPRINRYWWEAEADAFKPPFHLLAAILTYAPTKFVESRGGEPQSWSCYDLLIHISHEHNAGRSILLPSALWQRLITGLFDEDIDPSLLICRLAVQVLDNVQQAPLPFSGGVPLTCDMVPLSHLVSDTHLPNDLPSSVPLRQLCIINDYIISELSTNRNLITEDTISILLDTWDWTPPHLGASQAIFRRAERCILEVFVGDWWEGLSDTDVLIRCYTSVVDKYCLRRRRGIPSLNVFMKLFSELCWSSVVEDRCGLHISLILQYAFSSDVESTTAYYTFFCGLESPLFSPRSKLALHASFPIHRVTAAFVSGLARGSHPPSLTHQCMDFLCAEPDRLFTLCRVIASHNIHFPGVDEKKNIEANLVRLVRLDPRRAAWQDRKHYLVGVEPWDWPYLSVPQDHEYIGCVRDRMRFALEVLDDFFASLEDPSNSPLVSPPPYPRPRPVVRQSTEPGPPEVVSPWRRVRQLVSSTMVFRTSPSPMDIELAGPENTRSSRMSASESRHTLAMIEPAPPISSDATAGPSVLSRTAPAGDDSLV